MGGSTMTARIQCHTAHIPFQSSPQCHMYTKRPVTTTMRRSNRVRNQEHALAIQAQNRLRHFIMKGRTFIETDYHLFVATLRHVPSPVNKLNAVVSRCTGKKDMTPDGRNRRHGHICGIMKV